jgi:signal transduction histidine kinase
MFVMPPRVVDRLTIRSALALGFGLTLGIWVFAGYDFTGRVSKIQRDATDINVRYMRAQELLTNVRSEILLGSLSVRDAILDPGAGAMQRSERQIVDTFDEVDRALGEYVPIIDAPTEHERVERLRHELSALRAHMESVLVSQRDSGPEHARALLNSRVVPQRQIVIRVSEEVQSLNRAAFIRQQTEVAEVYSSTQRQLWTRLGAALLASLAVAFWATLHAGRLEQRLRQQRELEVRHSNDLQRLSAKLIDAQEEERRSIARELHDELGQVLSAIKMEIAIAKRGLESAGGAADVLSDAEAIADQALTTVRDLSRLLHPSLLDDLGLPAAVDWYLSAFGTRSGVRVELLLDRMDDRLQPQTEVTAYRIIQEALTNVGRHARATSCRVYLRRLPSTVRVTIEDDGVGFQPDDLGRRGRPRGLGLLGIQERVTLLRGTFRIDSRAGAGTRLTVELPAVTRADVPDVAGDVAGDTPELAHSEAVGA